MPRGKKENPQTEGRQDAAPQEGKEETNANTQANANGNGETPAEQPSEPKFHESQEPVVVYAEKSRNLDTICYRGFATLADLARVSQADVFDQVTNPDGLQRGLSQKHAADAYEYVGRPRDPQLPRAFPEVILNARRRNFVKVEQVTDGKDGLPEIVKITMIPPPPSANGNIRISRVDGNHRMFYADGSNPRRPSPLTANVPFQLHVGLNRDQESNLFVDVNANQKGLNSSHLEMLRSRLTPEQDELAEHPDRAFARRLAEDEQSPWHEKVHLGGSKEGSKALKIVRPVNFTALVQGVSRLLKKSQYIHDLTTPDAQYELIRRYWVAVSETFAEEWTTPREFLVLKNIGTLSLSTLGGTVIDRCMARGSVEVADMRAYLEQTRMVFDWHKDAQGPRSLAGMSGNRAALIIAGEMAGALTEHGSDEGDETKQIEQRLLAAA